jgi:hypothetical protein
MELIIQQITEGFVKKITEYFKESGMNDLGAMARDISAMVEETGRELLCSFIADADASLVAMKAERRADGVSVRERDVPRTLYTALGELTYKRTYFDTANGKMAIVDKMLGVNAYERVDTYVSARLVNEAAGVSFAKSTGIVTGGAISRQTARRKAIGCGELVALPQRLPETPERIHIFADEDHVHLQDGGSAVLPLITICSGKRKVCKGRHELLDRVCLNGYGLKPETFWEYAYAVCDEMFNMGKVREVFIYGDGARWIETSDVCFPYAVHVIDAHHYRKMMKTLTAGEICSEYSLRLHWAVKHRSKDAFKDTIRKMTSDLGKRMPACPERERKMKRVAEAADYILDRWDEVMNMRREGSIGSATEALVSHVLSERFSRNPMGWSKGGLAKMAQIRVFRENGGTVTASDISSGEGRDGVLCSVPTYIKKYDELIKRRQDKIFSKARDWRLFEHEHVEWAAPSGTKVVLDAMARMKDLA